MVLCAHTHTARCSKIRKLSLFLHTRLMASSSHNGVRGNALRPELRLSRSYNEQDFFRLYFLVSLNRTLITTRQMCGALNAINLKITYWWFLINECGAGKHNFFFVEERCGASFFLRLNIKLLNFELIACRL